MTELSLDVASFRRARSPWSCAAAARGDFGRCVDARVRRQTLW